MAPEIREIRHWFFVDKMKMLRGIPISDAHAGKNSNEWQQQQNMQRR
jgi:hypothetical protein